MKRKIMMMCLLMLTAGFFAACANEKSTRVETTNAAADIKKVQLTDSLQGSHYKDIYFSKQPALGDFDALETQGFTHVINLRPSSEFDEQAEQDKLAALGIQYTNIPFGPDDKLTDQYIQKVTQAVMAHRAEGKTLVHCSSSNRVGLWVGGHFYKDHHVTKAQAREAAAVAGMNKAPIQAKLDAYLATKP